MTELVITDNSVEKISIKSDGERFALVAKKGRNQWGQKYTRAIVLNQGEAAMLASFIKTEIKTDKDRLIEREVIPNGG